MIKVRKIKGVFILAQKTKQKLHVEENLCKGCGICVTFCPKNVLIIENDVVAIKNREDCIQCGQCELRCPDYAIYLGGK